MSNLTTTDVKDWLYSLSDDDFQTVWNRFMTENLGCCCEDEYIYYLNGKYYHPASDFRLGKYQLPLIDNFEWALDDLINNIIKYPSTYEYEYEKEEEDTEYSELDVSDVLEEPIEVTGE